MATSRLGPVEPLAQGSESGGAFLVVGRVHVDIEGLDAGRLDRPLDLLDVGVRRPEVKVDAADVVTGLRERDGSRLAHPGRAAQDQRPALAVVGHREGLHGAIARSSEPMASLAARVTGLKNLARPPHRPSVR